MTLQPFTNEQLNYFKLAFVVLNEFPKTLRQTFKITWDNNLGHLPGFQLWDDSTVVRNMFLATEGGSTKVPTHLSYNDWDCTALFQATIFASSFSLPDSSGHHRTLSYLYVKPHGLPPGGFHASVISPSGDNAETFSMAIDQLRLLRNAFCHSSSSEIVKATFDQYIQHTKDAFQALGMTSGSVDAIGSLSEVDFPIERVRKLEDDIRKELQAESTFVKEQVKDELMGIRSDIAQATQERRRDAERASTERKKEFQELKNQFQLHSGCFRSDIVRSNQAREEDATHTARERKDEFQEMNEKLVELNRKLDDAVMKNTKQESKLLLPRSCLPPSVSHFTGREKECNEIIKHVTAESTRIVSVWGSPGFGKTSIAIAVGHRLQAQGLPVYFISLHGMRLKSDLTSKLLGLFPQSATLSQRLTADDELCSIFNQISDRCIFILDNADDLFESGLPNVKEDVINLVEEIVNRSDKATFILTTRESCEFLNLRFQGHHAVRIRELDEQNSQHLVKELLPESSTSDVLKVTQICGNVPLAMKLLCSLISEDCSGQLSHCIDMFRNTTSNILQELDNSDYPSNMRLKSLFDATFQRLSIKERETLVSLCSLPEHFDLEIATAVLGIKTIEAAKVLQTLQRKSLIDCSLKSEKYSIHKLLLSFIREKGELDMKETVLNSKARFFEFYISLFEKLTEDFLTGSSMSAFIEFFQNEESIVQSLIDGCSDSRTVDRVCDVLAKAELYLSILYWNDEAMFEIIYDSAIKATTDHDGKNCVYRRLLLSKAYGEVILGSTGETKKLLSEARKIRWFASIHDRAQKGKLFSYDGIYQLIIGRTKKGVKHLEEALSSMATSSEHTILKIIVYQILAFYHSLKPDPLQSLKLYKRAVVECKAVGDMGLLVIPAIEKTTTNSDEDNTPSNGTRNAHNQPLQIEVILLVSQAVKNITNSETKQCFHSLLLQILKESESALPPGATGRFNYHYSGVRLLNKMRKREGSSLYVDEIINFHTKTVEGNFNKKYSETSPKNKDHSKVNYLEAVESNKRALDIRLKVFGEEHPETARSYHSLGVTQHSLGDLVSALESSKRALDIRLKVFGEEHSETARSYHSLGVTYHSLGDFVSALESDKRALDIRLKVFGEQHSETATSYHSLGVTYHSLGDFVSALESDKRALDIRLKVLGEEHSETADSYHSLGDTQHSMGDFVAALESEKRALDIRLKLFGEEHSETARSVRDIKIIENALAAKAK